MIIKGLCRRYERWNPVHPTSGAFWGMGIGIGCGVGWGPGFGPEAIGYVGAGCGVGFSVGITFVGFGIGLPANFLFQVPYNGTIWNFPSLLLSNWNCFILTQKIVINDSFEKEWNWFSWGWCNAWFIYFFKLLWQQEVVHWRLPNQMVFFLPEMLRGKGGIMLHLALLYCKEKPVEGCLALIRNFYWIMGLTWLTWRANCLSMLDHCRKSWKHFPVDSFLLEKVWEHF